MMGSDVSVNHWERYQENDGVKVDGFLLKNLPYPGSTLTLCLSSKAAEIPMQRFEQHFKSLFWYIQQHLIRLAYFCNQNRNIFIKNSKTLQYFGALK